MDRDAHALPVLTSGRDAAQPHPDMPNCTCGLSQVRSRNLTVDGPFPSAPVPGYLPDFPPKWTYDEEAAKAHREAQIKVGCVCVRNL